MSHLSALIASLGRDDPDFSVGRRPGGGRSSAVLALISEEGNDIVLTRRPLSLRHHAGQVALPGGRAENTDETIVDTTGAGDAFVGAFCASLAAGHALPVCLRRASVAGTLGCTKVGARAGAPRGDEIAARAANVAVAADFGDDVDDETKAAWLAAPAAAWTRRGYY